MLDGCEGVSHGSRVKDLVPVFFLDGSSSIGRSNLPGVPLWKDFVHFALLFGLDSLPASVVASAVVMVLRWVLGTGERLDVLGRRAMSVVFKPTEMMQLVPDRHVSACLYISLLGQSWLISDGQLLLFQADALDRLVRSSAVLMIVVVDVGPGKGTCGEDGRG